MGAEEREYVSDLKIRYGDCPADAPQTALRELTGLSNSINYGYGGKHVWLVPSYTRDAAAAATSFHIVVQTNNDSKMDDLAKGAGGGYRYMFCKADRDESSKIVHAVLLRTMTALSSPPPGWDMITTDINKGRRKSRLYIVFKTTEEQTKSVDRDRSDAVASSTLTRTGSFRTLLSIPGVGGYLSVRSSGYQTAKSSARNSAVVKDYILRLDVHYGDGPADMPSDCIREITGSSADIMYQESGRRVWLVPVYTTEAAKAATSFDVLIQPYQDYKLNDLAKGAGGEFRYVVPRADRKVAGRIIEVGLVRSERPIKAAPTGWDGFSVIDILNGRPKGSLQLVWKTAYTNSWSFVSLASISPFKLSNSPTPYISRLKVVYTDEIDEAPEEAVYEYNGQSADINYHFGGKYVWLVPEYTTELITAATAFVVSVQSIADLAFDDLAKGAGGDYRYIAPKYDAKVRAKVAEVQLLRTDTPVAAPPAGWHGVSADVNAGRQRTYLYVIWKCA